MMYNPVVERRRARSDTNSDTSSEDTDCDQGHSAQETPHEIDDETEGQMVAERVKPRRRRGRFTRRRQAQSWTDCSTDHPQSIQVHLKGRRRSRRRKRSSLYHSRSTPRRPTRVRGRRMRILSGSDCGACREKSSQRLNLSNNRRRSPWRTRSRSSSRSRRPHRLPTPPSVSHSFHGKKTVAFNPRVNCPERHSLVSKTKSKNPLTSMREAPRGRSVVRYKSPPRGQSDRRLDSECSAFANKRSHDPAVWARSRERSASGTAKSKNTGRNQLTRSECEVFRYLAKRLLGSHDHSSPPHLACSKAGPACGWDYLLDSHDPNNGSWQCCSHQPPNVLSSPDNLHCRGRNKSRSAKNVCTPVMAPRSKSLCNFKFNNELSKFDAGYPYALPDPVDACSKAMSGMHLKEKELMKKYGPFMSESNSKCGSYYPSNTINVHIKSSRPYQSPLACNDNHYLESMPHSLYKPQKNPKDILTNLWNSPGLEGNTSHNRYCYSSNQANAPVEIPCGNSRYCMPPFNARVGGACLPWSSFLNMSISQPQPLSSFPCPERNMIRKYLENDGVTGRKTSISPRRRSGQGSPRKDKRQAGGGRQDKGRTPPWKRVEGVTEGGRSGKGRTSPWRRVEGATEGGRQDRGRTPPWRRVEGATDSGCKGFSLDKLSGKKTAGKWSVGGTFENFLSGWQGRGRETIDASCNFSSDLTGHDGILSSARGGKVAQGAICHSSLSSSGFSLDRPGCEVYSTGITPSSSSATTCKLLTSGVSAGQSRGVLPMTSLGIERQKETASGPRPVDSCFKVEMERLERIGHMLR